MLRHNDIEVILPQQRPMPLPAICYGDVKGAKRELAFNVKHLAKAVHDADRAHKRQKCDASDQGYSKVLRTSLNAKEGIKRCQNTKCL